MAGGFQRILVARPLLSSARDMRAVGYALLKSLPGRKFVDGVIFMGHGSEHHPADGEPPNWRTSWMCGWITCRRLFRNSDSEMQPPRAWPRWCPAPGGPSALNAAVFRSVHRPRPSLHTVFVL
jgi:hypothetical protein